jgi:RNA polymerase sigma factor (TIGR02999 family)
MAITVEPLYCGGRVFKIDSTFEVFIRWLRWSLRASLAAIMSESEVNGDITRVLESIDQPSASHELLPLVYDELRRLAAARMAREMAGQTLQPTALVHEAWIRLFDGNAKLWRNRGHFFGAAAQAMRRILIERARRKLSSKRGGRSEHVNIEEVEIAASLPDERILLIDEALERLERRDPDLARVVSLKFFGGLTNAEVGETIGVTERTVQNKWTYAKAWLLESMMGETSPPA